MVRERVTPASYAHKKIAANTHVVSGPTMETLGVSRTGSIHTAGSRLLKSISCANLSVFCKSVHRQKAPAHTHTYTPLCGMVDGNFKCIRRTRSTIWLMCTRLLLHKQRWTTVIGLLGSAFVSSTASTHRHRRRRSIPTPSNTNKDVGSPAHTVLDECEKCSRCQVPSSTYAAACLVCMKMSSVRCVRPPPAPLPLTLATVRWLITEFSLLLITVFVMALALYCNAHAPCPLLGR